jgi:hypothetical protein
MNLSPFGNQPFGPVELVFPLAPLLEGTTKDAWMVVEAGLEQGPVPDLDDDGLPDLPEEEVPGRPAATSEPRFDLEAIAPGVWPTAFTNPFLLDLDANGWQAPGLSGS